MDLRTVHRPVNYPRLEQELRAALGDVYRALTVSDVVIVHLEDTATEAERADAEAIVAAHDPNALTPEQQNAVTRKQRKQAAAEKVAAANWGTIVSEINASNLPAQTKANLAFLVQMIHANSYINDLTDVAPWY